MSESIKKVQRALAALGLECQVLDLPASTRTAREAAEAVGCSIEQIVKSLVFRAAHSGRAVLVIASGVNRVNEALLSAEVGEPIEKADADFVRQATGFAIGGVPPLAHSQPLLTFIDRDLFQYDEIWAAAGTPHAVFCLRPADLLKMGEGKVIAIT